MSLNRARAKELPYQPVRRLPRYVKKYLGGRWVYRLSEVIGACAIPVFLADGRDAGWRLPFNNLIDWNSVTIQLGERFGLTTEEEILDYIQSNPAKLLEALPKDQNEIRRMREKICEINDQYFQTDSHRGKATLKSAMAVRPRETHH
jgi:hypothetical protein